MSKRAAVLWVMFLSLVVLPMLALPQGQQWAGTAYWQQSLAGGTPTKWFLYVADTAGAAKADCDRYEILWSQAANDPTQPDGKTTPIDVTVKPHQAIAYMRLTAVDQAGNESGFSNEFALDLPDVWPPNNPHNFRFELKTQP